MLKSVVIQISNEMNLTKEQSERVVDLVLTEVKQKLPYGFQKNFVAVMNGERDFNIMDNFGGVLGADTSNDNGDNDDNEQDSSTVSHWKNKINQRLSTFKNK